MKNKILIVFALILLPLISAESQTLGTFAQGQNVSLIQGCDNSTYANLTRISFPNSSFALNTDTAMAKNGDNYNYTFANTYSTGQYLVYGECDENGVSTTWVYSFNITPSGAEITQGQAVIVFGSLAVMILISFIFLYFGSNSEDVIKKLGFNLAAIVGFMMVILYMVIIIQQNLFQFSSIITGVETFWFVVKMGLTLGIVIFLVIIFRIFWKMYQIKRGLADD